ncbi:TPA: ImmA/IrrE family metallo-endopeptidase [Legionella pneumophila]|nr:ImmA/IrrE family metallo-endopeptidase [Legionella pneumophila]HAU1546689.1 ImmA/IrrE family metallo-endopeptidase [Legionella pneumophila]
MKNLNLQLATTKAENIIKEEGLQLPIDLFSLAERNDIEIVSKPIDAKGVSGMLIRHRECFTIAYATHIENEGFQRFSIAHELGHYFLPSHPEKIFKDGDIHESHAGYSSSNPIEKEADHFAASLLMPKYLTKKIIAKYQDGLNAIKNMSEVCKTSLISSAIRYTELTDAAVAIIVSSGSKVEYSFVSPTIYKLKGYTHLTSGMHIPKNSGTYSFNKKILTIDQLKDYCTDTDLMDWFHTDHQISATEEVISLGSYDKILTVITANIEENEDLEDEWDEPHF